MTRPDRRDDPPMTPVRRGWAWTDAVLWLLALLMLVPLLLHLAEILIGA